MGFKSQIALNRHLKSSKRCLSRRGDAASIQERIEGIKKKRREYYKSRNDKKADEREMEKLVDDPCPCCMMQLRGKTHTGTCGHKCHEVCLDRMRVTLLKDQIAASDRHYQSQQDMIVRDRSKQRFEKLLQRNIDPYQWNLQLLCPFCRQPFSQA